MRASRFRIVLAVLLGVVSMGCVLPYGTFARADSAYGGGSSAIVLEVSTNRILYQSNAYAVRSMASTTKILTAITVIENCDLNEIVRVDKAAVGVEGSSIYLEEGEEIAVIDLLYGLMLQSGNDAATALALHTAKTIPAFAELMNKTAQKAGAKHSNFVNPHGLDNKDHYTTAFDLALISTYALKNPSFGKIVGSKNHAFIRPRKGGKYTLFNKNKILSSYDGGDGVKTGFTKKAGRCLVASATRNGMQVVAVVLNCAPMFEECRRLMSNAFSEYKMTEALPAYHYLGTTPVLNGTAPVTRCFSREPFLYPMRAGEKAAITITTKLDENLRAPVRANQRVGEISVFLHNRLLTTQDAYSIDSVPSVRITDRLRDIIHDFVR